LAGRIGGVNVFGGGTCPVQLEGTFDGAIGVTATRRAADHNIAWRHASHADLDFVPFGVSAKGDDNITIKVLCPCRA